MCLPFAHMHSLCSGENILIAASIEVLVVLLHSIAHVRRKVLYSLLSIAHQIIPTCGKVKLRNSCVVFTVLYKTEGCFHSEGHFYFVSQLNFQNLQSDTFDFVVKQSGTPYK